MQNLFEEATFEQINERLESLSPNSKGQWGKMEAEQMLAHCSAVLVLATGQATYPRSFIGRIMGTFIKATYYNEKQLARNSPTDSNFLIKDQRDFDVEKKRLIRLIKQFHDGGEAKCTSNPHPFFGKLTPEQWAIGMYKHLDHHLRQFNS